MSARTSPRSGNYYGRRLLLLRRIEDLIRELEVAISAAREAGEVLREGFGAEQAVRYKGEVDIVTEADECAEDAGRGRRTGGREGHSLDRGLLERTGLISAPYLGYSVQQRSEGGSANGAPGVLQVKRGQ
jgi:hypothetical protein